MDQDKKEGEETKEAFMPGYQTVHEFSSAGFKRVVNGVKAFQALPQPGPSWDLHKSYPEFSRSMKNARSKLIPMMASLLKHVNIPTSDFRSRDIDEKFEFLVDCNDDLLERIGTSLDEAEGLFTKSEIVVVDKGIANTSLKTPGTWGKRKLDNINAESDNNQTENSGTVGNRPMKKPLYRFRVTEKPQLKFSQPIDNSTAAFVPKLKEKPHSLKPLSILPEYTAKNEEFFSHPYAVELNKWEPPDNLLSKVIPQTPKDPKSTPTVYVSTQRDLEKLMYDLLNVKQIAVDVEHHSYRTYLGLTCLIQLSTREKDYVIDGLSLRDDLSNLNEIFADPKVLKVFHGSSSDIEWLQRDFGLYIVNMFDTYLAAKVLGLPQLSLQYLLGKFCNVSQNKALQLADWRLRPLTDDMLEYARLDTHYLLYIYDLLRNQLIENGNKHNNLLLSVFDQSKQLCLKRYEKPPSNAQLALRKTRRNLNNRQLYAFTEIYKWRDLTAREKDESWGYVLPNHMLLTIAESLPKEMNGILACCDPVPPLIQSNLGKIHKIITTARELPLQQKSAQKNKVEKKVKLKNWVVVVNSIHDVAPVESSESVGDPDEEEEGEFVIKNTLSSDNTVWPQPWVDPGDWKQFVRKTTGPSLIFNRNSRQRQQIRELSTEESMATPFGRYEISKRIMDMLKDPKKQSELDMEDPLVKAVHEAVLVEDKTEEEEVREEQPVAEPARVLDEGEFVPFNPLAEPSKKKRKKKERKYDEAWDDGNQVEQPLGEPSGIGIGMQDDTSEYAASSSAPTLLQFPNNKRSRKAKKGKFLKKIKNAFTRSKKGSYEVADNNQEDLNSLDHRHVSEITEPSEKDTKRQEARSTSPNKRMRREDGYQTFPGNRRNRNRGHNSSPQQNRDFKNKQPKNKMGIFKAWKKDNQSITFK